MINIIYSILYVLTAFCLPILIGHCVKKQSTNNTDLNLRFSQSIKGIACVLVALGHAVSSTGVEELRWLNIGWICVGIFFFWSGYGVSFNAKRNSDYMKSFLKKRLIKIFIPFFTAHIVYLFVKCIFGKSFSIVDILLSLMGQCNVVDNGWYPISIIIFYILFWISYRFIKKKFLTLFILVICLTFIQAIIFGTNDWWYISNLSFILGVYIAEKKLVHKWYIYLIICIGVYFLSSALSHFTVGSEYYQIIYVIISNLQCASITLSVIVCTSAISFEGKITQFIGEISYEIYLMHGLIIFILNNLNININPILFVSIVVIVSIIISIPLHNVNVFIIKKFDNMILKLSKER